MDKLRAGILGLGNIAHKHAQAVADLNDDLELVALCGRTEDKVRAFADQHGARNAAVYTDHRAMLERARLDVLVDCLPPFARSDSMEIAAERGVNVLMEKPIAATSEQAWRMVNAAERAKIKTQVGFMYRFGAAVDALKARIQPSQVGLFSARYFCNSLHAAWWRDPSKSGGQVVEQAIHLIDLLRYLVGEPDSVYSRQSNFFHQDIADYHVEDVSATVFGFRNGALGVVYATNAARPGQWIKEWRVVASGVLAEFTDWNHATITTTTDVDQSPLVISSDRNVFVLQLRDLISAIRTGSSTRTPLREGARSLDLALAAVRSAGTHREISL